MNVLRLGFVLLFVEPSKRFMSFQLGQPCMEYIALTLCLFDLSDIRWNESMGWIV